MARMRTVATLGVHLNSRLVGRLTRAASGAVAFQYDESWLAWAHAFAISLALPLRAEHYTGALVNAVFDNLLPDSEQIRRRLAERMHADGTDAFNLLTVIGRDCVGALQFLPEGLEPGPAGEIKGKALSEGEVAAMLRNLESAPLGVDQAREFRISLAGAQEKTALLFQNGVWQLPQSSTATTHILKPPIGRRAGHDLSQSVENEFLCHQILAGLGLPVASSRIADFEDQRVLVVERFDRRWTGDGRLLRLPQEDCCQALGVPPARRYQSDGGPGLLKILELLKGGDTPHEDRKLFLKAQMAFWLLGATDGHAKNFSVFITTGGGFHLTPLYDVLSTQPLLDAGSLRRTEMKLAMAVGDKMHYRVDEITPRHFAQSAGQAGVPFGLVTEITEELVKDIPLVLEELPSQVPSNFPEALLASIAAGTHGRLKRLAAG